MANPAKTKGINGWLKKIGEEPVVYDPEFTKKSTGQLKQYLENKGYHFAEIEDTTIYIKKKCHCNVFGGSQRTLPDHLHSLYY